MYSELIWFCQRYRRKNDENSILAKAVLQNNGATKTSAEILLLGFRANKITRFLRLSQCHNCKIGLLLRRCVSRPGLICSMNYHSLSGLRFHWNLRWFIKNNFKLKQRKSASMFRKSTIFNNNTANIQIFQWLKNWKTIKTDDEVQLRNVSKKHPEAK